uniref:Cleavage/polyadenylation specificity factor, 25kDa subunit n=1 Tax=Tanacetum cinerariifolium TaxID=118510 RepID=A0A6L2J6R8_TANCI|nr:cleavage/polyadenylation specificity factor, 25kDa subunit [Tanacetum cinerariifolium]
MDGSFRARVKQRVTTEVEVKGKTVSVAEQMWNSMVHTIIDAAKETLGVVSRASRIHIGHRESWWLSDEVQIKVKVKQTGLRELILMRGGDQANIFAAEERYKEAKREAKKDGSYKERKSYHDDVSSSNSSSRHLHSTSTGQRQSTTVNAAGHRSTPTDHGGDQRSTTVAGGEPPLTAAGPPLTTTGPSVNGGWWAGQSWAWAGSGSGLGRVWAGSATCAHVCPRGIHVDADVDNMQRVGVEPGTYWIDS